MINTYEEKQKEKNKKYYQGNKENRKEYQKNWNKNHKDKVLKIIETMQIDIKKN